MSWLTTENFNTVRNVDDRQCSNPIHQAEVRDFNDFMIEKDMHELKSTGRWFTWTNNHVFRIERALVNADWMIKLPHLEVNIMDPKFSNHSYFGVTLNTDNQRGHMPLIRKLYS